MAVLGDLHSRVGNEVIEGIVGRHGVPGRNESGERLLEMCAEQELVVGNSSLKKNDVYKYTCLRMADLRVVDKALMDYLLLPRQIREVNVRVLGKVLELLSANGGRFEINQLLFADDTALVAGSEEKLCRFLSEFGRVCERRKLRVNVGKSKVMRCSRYGNGNRMHVILNGEPL